MKRASGGYNISLYIIIIIFFLYFSTPILIGIVIIKHKLFLLSATASSQILGQISAVQFIDQFKVVKNEERRGKKKSKESF